MSRVVVLGGCGGIGSVAVKTLAESGEFDDVVIADKDIKLSCEFAESLRAVCNVSAAEFDAESPDSTRKVIEGSSVVLNCVGPFYRFGPSILKTVIESGINYVDVCDDLDATEKMLALDDDAKNAGICALIGMGNSPGMANVIARWCADEMLDSVEAVDIFHAHGGEQNEGGAVVKHRIHAMTSDIPLFVNGEFITVRMLEKSGERFVEETEFAELGTYPVYPYPHPETITLPRFLKGVKRVVNMGVVLPLEYFELTKSLVRLGICSEEPLKVGDQEIVPLEFAVAYILSKRQEILKRAGMNEPTGCLKVRVRGEKDGKPHTYVFSMFSKGAGAGEGTGIPAALGAMMMASGAIKGKGVLPPEACVSPREMLKLAGSVIKGTRLGERVPLYIEHIDKSGRVEMIDFRL